jgi:hypothetical protein
MAFCFECGVLMHNDDQTTHVCKVEDKPLKGAPITLTRTK